VRGGAGFTLQRYLDNLSTYAETSCNLSDNESDRGVHLETSHNGLPFQDLASEDTFYDTSLLEQMPIKPLVSTPKNPTLSPSENPGLPGLKRSEPRSKKGGIGEMLDGLLLESRPDHKRSSPILTKDKEEVKRKKEEEEAAAGREARRTRRAEKEASEKAAAEERRKKEEERRERRRKQNKEAAARRQEERDPRRTVRHEEAKRQAKEAEEAKEAELFAERRRARSRERLFEHKQPNGSKRGKLASTEEEAAPHFYKLWSFMQKKPGTKGNEDSDYTEDSYSSGRAPTLSSRSLSPPVRRPAINRILSPLVGRPTVNRSLSPPVRRPTIDRSLSPPVRRPAINRILSPLVGRPTVNRGLSPPVRRPTIEGERSRNRSPPGLHGGSISTTATSFDHAGSSGAARKVMNFFRRRPRSFRSLSPSPTPSL
jgi:hypothetical protein